MDNNSRKRHIFLLIVGTLLYFTVNFQRTAVPGAIFDELQSDLNCQAGAITAMGSSFMYIYAFCQLLTGLMADRFGGFRTILFGGFFFMVGSLGFPFAHALWMMYLLRAFTGLGASCVYLSMIKEFSRLYPKKFTVFFGTFMFIGYMGGMTAGSPFVAAVHAFNWRTLLAGLGLCVAALYLSFAGTLVSCPKEVSERTPFSVMPLLKVYANPLNRRLACFSAVNWGIYYTSLTVIGKKFLQDYCNMGMDAAALVITIMGIVSASFNFISGIVSHAIGNRRRPFMYGGACLAAICYLLICTALACNFRSSALAAVFLLVTLPGSVSPVQVALMHEMNAPENGGVTVAVLNFTSYLMVAFFSNVCGFLLERFSPTVVDGVKIYGRNSYLLFFAFALAVILFGLINVRRLPETNGENIYAKSR